jgi:hypothetical protein
MLISLVQSSFGNEDMCIFQYVFYTDLFLVYVGTVQYYCHKGSKVVFRSENIINTES